jgi:hypothetical protein
MSERTKKHVDKLRKKLLSKQKRRRSEGLKESLESETRNEWLWVLLVCQFQRPKSLGERSGIGYVYV